MKYKFIFILLFSCQFSFAQFLTGKFISPEIADVRAIVIADINADGSNDVVAASEYYGKVVWYQNDGTGSFGSSILIAERTDPIMSMQVGDVNGDAVADIVLTDSGGNLLYYPNDGTGVFEEEVVLDTNVGFVTDFNLVDISQDGNLDILLTSFWEQNIIHYVNNGMAESWQKNIVAEDVKGVIDAQVGDIDNDGDLDIVSVSAMDNQIGWYENIGWDTFLTFHLLTEYVDFPNSVIVADLDGNQLVDIGFVPKQEEGGKIFWLPNMGSGSFGEPIQILNATRETLSVSDVDLDGDMDILSGGMIVYNTDGLGTFQSSEYISGYSGSLLRVGELNGDGYLDVLLADSQYADNQIFWHANIGGGTNYGTRQNISYTANEPRNIYSVDLNQDGKMDIVSTSRDYCKVAWYPNKENNFD
ncbi:MAG: FG-GAP repeat domain-containing protein, partial [Chitinophagales bacterium]